MTPATGACTNAKAFRARRKRHVIANVAIARELAGETPGPIHVDIKKLGNTPR